MKNKVTVKYSLWKFLSLLSLLSGSFVFLYLGYIWFPQNVAVYGDVMESKKAQIPQCNENSHEDEQYIKTLATFLRCEVESKGNREQLFALPRKLSKRIFRKTEGRGSFSSSYAHLWRSTGGGGKFIPRGYVV